MQNTGEPRHGGTLHVQPRWRRSNCARNPTARWPRPARAETLAVQLLPRGPRKSLRTNCKSLQNTGAVVGRPLFWRLFSNVTAPFVVRLWVWPLITLENNALHMSREKINIYAQSICYLYISLKEASIRSHWKQICKLALRKYLNIIVLCPYRSLFKGFRMDRDWALLTAWSWRRATWAVQLCHRSLCYKGLGRRVLGSSAHRNTKLFFKDVYLNIWKKRQSRNDFRCILEQTSS